MGLGVAIALGGVPDDLLASASTVEVQERAGEATAYRLRYQVDIDQGDLPLLVESKFDAGSDLSVLVPVDNAVQCLVKGPVNAQQIHLAHGGAGSWMEVSGTDSSLAMDRETRAAVWSEVTDSDAVLSILSTYGFLADVEATDSRHLENKHALVQRETDLRFIRRLARRNGYLFWISCDAVGIETAHFKRTALGGEADAEIVINLGTPMVQAVDFNWDVERPTAVSGAQVDLNTLSDIEGTVAASSQAPLGSTDLPAAARASRSIHLTAPADDAGDLQARGNATLAESDWFLRATCQTSLDRAGVLLRPNSIVELRGAGSRYSGRYLVSSVTHTIDAAQHRMDLELVRNGWGS